MTRSNLYGPLMGFILMVAPPAFAADDPPASDLIVTATRLPTPAALAPDVHVVTGQEIDRRQATFAFDVLNDIPGVQASRSGAYGGIASVKIRGASSDKTLVLIDGAPVNDPTAPSGGFDFSALDLADVDRIEVLSGPQGSLWGSDAIGGVVSITTLEPKGLRVLGEGGSYATARGAASVGLSDTVKAIGASVAWFSTDGISSADSRDGNTERDGFRSFTAQVNGRWTPVPEVSLDGKVRYNNAHADNDSFGGPTGVIDGPDTVQSRTVSGYLRARIEGPLGFVQTLRADGMDMDRLSKAAFGGTLFPFEALGRRIDLRWTAERANLGPNSLLFGVEHESAREDTGDGVQTARNWAGFAVWRFTPSQRFSTSVSVRRDSPRDYKGVTTVRASAVAVLGAGFSVDGDFGQGFKAPSIYQTTYPCFECATPGPAVGLKPERAIGWDAGLSWRSHDSGLSARVTVYGLTVRDQIDYAFPNGYMNIDRAKTTGVEAEADAVLMAGFRLHGQYAYAHARDVSTGLALLRVPAHSGSVSLLWSGSRADGELTLRSQSGANDFYGNEKAFAVVNVAGSYRLTDHIRLTGRVENLTNTHYQVAFGYGEPGISVFAGFKITD